MAYDSKRPIHTTLSKDCSDWLARESELTHVNQNELIEIAINFYRNNKLLLEEYKQARIYLKEIVKEELLDEYTKAKPLIKRLIDEERDHK